MKVLIVKAIHDPQSFGGQLVTEAQKKLTAEGHEIFTSDLYKKKFLTIAYADTFQTRANPDFFDLQAEQFHSFANNLLPESIKTEQQKIQDADLVVFAAPVYWSSPPAVMRGWIEQVLVQGFAYDGEHIFDKGLLAGKSAFFLLTHAGKLGAATKLGVASKAQNMLKGLHERPLQYSGFKTLDPVTVSPPPYPDQEVRLEALMQSVSDVMERVAQSEAQNKIAPEIHR